MTKRILTGLVGLLLIAGCTTGVTFTPGPVMTGPTATTAPAEVAHVTLTVTITHSAVVRYSNGVTTESVTIDDEANVPVSKTITFDAPRPLVAAATIVAEAKGHLSCSIDSNGFGSSGGTVNNGTWADCNSGEDQKHNFGTKPVAGEHVVTFLATSTKTDGTAMWASKKVVGEDRADLGKDGVITSHTDGTVHMIVAAFRKGDTVTCRILVDGIQQARAVTTGIGDIANCSADVK